MEKSLTEVVDPSETALELFVRCKKSSQLRVGIEFIDVRCKHLDSKREDVIQVSGESSTGKSQIVLHALATCVLPESLGGEGSSAVLFDLDMKFEVERFHQILSSRITLDFRERAQGDETISKGDYENVLKECCDRVYVYRCMTNLDFLTALYALPALAESKGIRLVVVETLATFYWETAETDAPASGLHVAIPQAIRSLLRTCKLTVLAVKPTLFHHKWQKDSDGFDYTSATWKSMVSTHVDLAKTTREGNYLAKTRVPNYNLSASFGISDTGIASCAS